MSEDDYPYTAKVSRLVGCVCVCVCVCVYNATLANMSTDWHEDRTEPASLTPSSSRQLSATKSTSPSTTRMSSRTLLDACSLFPSRSRYVYIYVLPLRTREEERLLVELSLFSDRRSPATSRATRTEPTLPPLARATQDPSTTPSLLLDTELTKRELTFLSSRTRGLKPGEWMDTSTSKLEGTCTAVETNLARSRALSLSFSVYLFFQYIKCICALRFMWFRCGVATCASFPIVL